MSPSLHGRSPRSRNATESATATATNVTEVVGAITGFVSDTAQAAGQVMFASQGNVQGAVLMDRSVRRSFGHAVLLYAASYAFSTLAQVGVPQAVLSALTWACVSSVAALRWPAQRPAQRRDQLAELAATLDAAVARIGALEAGLAQAQAQAQVQAQAQAQALPAPPADADLAARVAALEQQLQQPPDVAHAVAVALEPVADRVAALEPLGARVAALEARAAVGDKRTSAPPSPDTPSKRRRGGQGGRC
jgi:BMFP domain-containing protein YqiC